MAKQKIERKVAVIFATDVVSYSKHMEADESKTIAALGKMDTTNALTAPCEKKCSTPNGFTPHGKPRSLSMFGSGNTTRSDLITH